MDRDLDRLSCTSARILLAEDDDELRSLLASTLREAGFDVTEATDGGALLEALISGASSQGNTEAFDMVLSDISMPKFHALDVLFGARSRLTATPVVLITAFPDAQTREQALRLGAAAVLEKPLRLDQLASTLVQILMQPRSNPSAPRTSTPLQV